MRKRKMTTLYLMTGVLVLSLLIGLLVHYQLSVDCYNDNQSAVVRM